MLGFISPENLNGRRSVRRRPLPLWCENPCVLGDGILWRRECNGKGRRFKENRVPEYRLVDNPFVRDNHCL